MSGPYFEWREAPAAQFAVIGDPVSHSMSPKMQAAALRSVDIVASYVAIRVPSGQVAAALAHLKQLGYVGVNVTVPHKQEAYEALQSCDPVTAKVGAVNTIRLDDMAGRNTDADGFLDVLKWHHISRETPVLVLGAGGSARAIVLALENEGFSVKLWNRTLEKALALKQDMGLRCDAVRDISLSGVGLVVNATSALLTTGEQLPIPWAEALPGLAAFDLMYREGGTPFLQEAREQTNGDVIDGRELLVAQGKRSMEWWLGQTVSVYAMEHAVFGSVPNYRVRRSYGVAASIEDASEAIRQGELVVMPTETVYGLAGNAEDEVAVRRIFAAKNRPADHPLIVHCASAEKAKAMVSEWPAAAQQLADAFWPGPLTLVLPAAERLNRVVTGGLDTVALRVPSHPSALDILEKSGCALAAPSANLFTRLSPTSAEDVSEEILEQAWGIIDGGPCDVGIESTILDLTVSPPRILRPGIMSSAAIAALIGDVEVGGELGIKAPGSHRLHYSPRTPLRLVEVLGADESGIAFQGEATASRLILPSTPDGFARSFYAALHELDGLGLEEILIENPPEDGDWQAVWDRLRRALGQG